MILLSIRICHKQQYYLYVNIPLSSSFLSKARPLLVPFSRGRRALEESVFIFRSKDARPEDVVDFEDDIYFFSIVILIVR